MKKKKKGRAAVFVTATFIIVLVLGACNNAASSDNGDNINAVLGFVLVEGTTVSGHIKDSEIFITGRTVTLNTFYMSDHEVTQEEYERYCEYGAAGHKPSELFGLGNDYPAYGVNWYDALVYCNKRSAAEGLTPCYTINNSTDPSQWGSIPHGTPGGGNPTALLDAAKCDFKANGYRLPTEVEWEYAARGGKDGMAKETQTSYAGSDNIDEVAWYRENSKGGSSQRHTHEVKTKQANTLGIFDMSGNACEWCWDWLTMRWDGITASTPFEGPASSERNARVYRGGDAYDRLSDCTVFYRYGKPAYTAQYHYSFRVVRTAE